MYAVILTSYIKCKICTEKSRYNCCNFLCSRGPGYLYKDRTLIFEFMIIWSSNEAYVVDALAARDDEGRGRLRKASGSSQTCFDPGVSEWGNPLYL